MIPVPLYLTLFIIYIYIKAQGTGIYSELAAYKRYGRRSWGSL